MSDEILTILFTDVEWSTALHAAKGDVEARRILGGCDELIRQQVREHGGREIKSTGDGFLIAFGSPRRAVACALAIQKAAVQVSAPSGYVPGSTPARCPRREATCSVGR